MSARGSGDGFDQGGRGRRGAPAALAASAFGGVSPTLARVLPSQVSKTAAMGKLLHEVVGVTFDKTLARLEDPAFLSQATRGGFERAVDAMRMLAAMTQASTSVLNAERAARLAQIAALLEDEEDDDEEISALAALFPGEAERNKGCIRAVYAGRRRELLDSIGDVLSDAD